MTLLIKNRKLYELKGRILFVKILKRRRVPDILADHRQDMEECAINEAFDKDTISAFQIFDHGHEFASTFYKYYIKRKRGGFGL
jgi:hypothetical protein